MARQHLGVGVQISSPVAVLVDWTQMLARQALIPASGHVAVEALQVLPRLCRCVCTSSGTLMNAQPQQAPRQEPESEQQQAQAQTSAGQQQQEQQQQQSQQEAGNAGASSTGNPEEMGQKAYSAFKSGFETLRGKIGSAAGAAAGGHPHLMGAMAQEFRDVFRSADNIRSATRLYTGPVMEAGSGDGTSALQIIKQQQSTWQRLQEQLSSWPLFSKLRSFNVTDTSAYKKSQEALDDLKEKYETSDHPMVHKVDEVKEKLLAGSESSRAMREVRTRDPSFDLNYFVRAIKLDAPVVVRALLHKDMEALSLHLGPEMMERLGGIFKHDQERGWFEDPTILFVSDVEIVEVRLMDNDPFVVAQFHCQQLKCARDKFGNVVEGSPDAIQRVYYFWGLQQEKTGVVTADGQVLPPRWVIRDMMWQSMLALV